MARERKQDSGGGGARFDGDEGQSKNRRREVKRGPVTEILDGTRIHIIGIYCPAITLSGKDTE